MSGKKKTNLGRALIKDRFRNTQGKKKVETSMLHSADVEDGIDWARLNLKSVTEESSFDAFFSIAELAGTEFMAERLNVNFVNPKSNVGLLTRKEQEKLSENHREKKKCLKIPRRPKWDASTTAEELQTKERQEFLEWRRNLSSLQEDEGLLLTPYEKNLDFWRQLWRVVERSDIVVQIVDARNPLLFRCEDLERYVKEVSPNKKNLILLNKADFLTGKQRKAWASYFESIGVNVAFFSAVEATDVIPEEEEEAVDGKKSDVQEETKGDDEAPETSEEKGNSEGDDEGGDEGDDDGFETEEEEEIIGELDEDEMNVKNSSKLLSREELIDFFKSFHKADYEKVTPGVTTVGLVGYPNVGKSSTINALLTCKKVSVSATPGKTKHFQTLFLDSNLLLCDCPGLVTPSFVFTKADMIINGILPIDQMRDHVPPVNLVCTLIPREALEQHYGIMIPRPEEGEDPDRPPFSEELLNAYAYNRGFMTSNGQPDNPRSSRYVLKDFVNGRLLYCTAPPGWDQSKYHQFKVKKVRMPRPVTPLQHRILKPVKTTATELDQTFFDKKSTGVHMKGTAKYMPGVNPTNSGASSNFYTSSPSTWRKQLKEKRHKKEKLRRVYRHLDE
nr:PREDICTED: large subunit GTPase 1 homolog [Bemisia tabaci]